MTPAKAVSSLCGYRMQDEIAKKCLFRAFAFRFQVPIPSSGMTPDAAYAKGGHPRKRMVNF